MFSIGYASDQGGRAYMEDRASAYVYDDKKVFCGIFDGHGGFYASSHLAATFPIVLSKQKTFDVPINALQSAWMEMDNSIKHELQKVAAKNKLNTLPNDGSTATVVLIDNNNVYITNCGDSACYSISRNGKFNIMTEDHGTKNADEVRRVLSVGGSLKTQQHFQRKFPFCCFKNEVETAKPRLYPGGLLVTRSFGDFHSKILNNKVVISDHGSIKYINLTSCNEDDSACIDYIILASDGVWDALSIDEIKDCFNNVVDDLNGSTDNNNGLNNRTDKIIPTNVNTFDNIYTNNKGTKIISLILTIFNLILYRYI